MESWIKTHMNTDQLQNEILTLAHHLDDIEKSIEDGESDYALEGIKDAREAISRLNHFLPKNLGSEMSRMAESKISAIANMITEDPNTMAEGHPYLRKTSRGQEKRLNKANVRAMKSSGYPGHGINTAARNELIGQAEKSRPLRRSEFIDKYGYDAWMDYVEKHGLPETHKWADA